MDNTNNPTYPARNASPPPSPSSIPQSLPPLRGPSSSSSEPSKPAVTSIPAPALALAHSSLPTTHIPPPNDNDVIDLEDCLLDSPPYRERLARCDNYLSNIEGSLRTLIKTARELANLLHALSQSQDALAEALIEVGRVEANRPTREPAYTPFFGVSNLESWSTGQHISKGGGERARRLQKMRPTN